MFLLQFRLKKMNNKHKLMEQKKRGEIISGKKAKLEKGLKFNEVIYEHKSEVSFFFRTSQREYWRWEKYHT